MMNLPLSFWDTMAKNYPRYNDTSLQYDVNHVLQWAESKGVSFNKRSILDIGCGTGTFAIPLALRNATITALDVSEGMLNVLREDATKLSLDASVSLYQSDWDDFELQKTYDIVIASMTPAISNEILVDKMIDAAHTFGLYVGWGSYKINTFVDTLMAIHKFNEKSSAGCIKTEKLITYMNHKKIPITYDYFQTSWSNTYSYDEALAYAQRELQRKNIAPNKEKIDELIKDFTQDGKVTIETRAEKGMVIFTK